MESERWIRLAFFVGLFLLFALWEWYTPRRRLTVRRWVRWLSNLALVALNTVAVPLISPIVAMGMAVIAAERGWGLFNVIEVAPWMAIAGSILALDFIIYWQHIAFHRIPILWRLHCVHHTDVDLDVTSGSRFHLIEILISMMIKVAATASLGVPVLAVLVFEVILNGMAMFNHANIRLPLAIDRVLRLAIVTPDMHRVHHSIVRAETDSNFGFNLPWWDRLFGTYNAQPAAGHEAMTIGLPIFRNERDQHLHRLLIQPFLKARRSGEPEVKSASESSVENPYKSDHEIVI